MAKVFIIAWVILSVGVGLRFNMITTSRENTIRMDMEKIAQEELSKDIKEIRPNWHPEIEKYFLSAGANPKSGYAWCGYFKHWLNQQVGIPGKGGWAASWIADKKAIRETPAPSDGFAIPRTGGSGWHVGHVSQVREQYIVTIEGNISDRLISRKITRDRPGIVYYSYINH